MVCRAVVHKRKFIGGLALCLLVLALTLIPVRFALAAPNDAAVQVADQLRAVAETDETVTFWSGGTAERPHYTWTFNGLDISKRRAAELTSLDLDIALSAGDADGSGMPDTLMLAFSYEGELPLPAQISVLLPGDFEGNRPSLFYFDEQNGIFSREIYELTVEGDYATFVIRSVYPRALSSIDLTMWTGTITPVPLETGEVDEPDSTLDLEETPTPTSEPRNAPFSVFSLPMPLLIGLGLAVICAFVLLLVVHFRRRAAIAAMQKGWQLTKVSFEDIPSLDELIEVEETHERRP
jgi:hypothetical protein